MYPFFSLKISSKYFCEIFDKKEEWGEEREKKSAAANKSWKIEINKINMFVKLWTCYHAIE